MKKGLVVLLVLVVAVGAFLYFPRGEALSALNSAVLGVLNGGITASRSGADFAAAYDGDVFATGDVVRSDDTGNGLLTFFDGSTVSIDPGANVKVTSLSKPPDGGIQAQLEQTVGRTWSSVAQLTGSSKYEIKTPTLTATVRGTAFETIVEVLPNGQVRVTIRVQEGQVLVTALAGGTVTVGAGQEVSIGQGEKAPASASPQKPTARLRFTVPAGLGFTVIDPRGWQCGSIGGAAVRAVPRCVLGSAVIGDVVAGTYVLLLTASQAVSNAEIVADGLGAGGGTDFSVKLARTFAAGELVRTTLPVAIGPDGKLSTTGFTAPEVVTSACGAEASGRVFSFGKATDRVGLLGGFAFANKGAPAALVYTQAELQETAVQTLKDAQTPFTVTDVKVTVDYAGAHVAANVSAGPLSFAAKADIVGAAPDGKLLLRIRSLDAGPIPPAAVAQIIGMGDDLLSQVGDGIPLVVQRVVFRTGCFALIGKTPS